LVAAKVRERPAVCKQATQKIDTERFNFKKLNEEDVTEEYQITIRNKFAALENLEDTGDINRAWDKLERTSTFRPKRVSVTVNQIIINHGLMRNVQNCLIEGSRTV
jgi:glycine betaine/choline ABC-type transport system substrate-binding protein